MKLIALALALFFAATLAKAASGNQTIFVGMDPERGFDLVEHFREPKNQKSFLASRKSAAEKVYFQKVFAELSNSRETAVINENVATFIDKKSRVLQIIVIKHPRLFAVNGKIVSIPVDRAASIFEIGQELIKAAWPEATGKAVLLRPFLNEALANGAPVNGAFPLVFLYLGSGRDMSSNWRAKPSEPQPMTSFEDRLPAEFINLLKAGKNGKPASQLACSSGGHELSGGGLKDFKWKARKSPGEDVVEIAGADHVIKVKVPRFDAGQSQAEFNKQCMPNSKDIIILTSAKKKCAESFELMKKSNAGFVNGHALGALDGAEICDKDKANCAPLDRKRMEAFKREPPVQTGVFQAIYNVFTKPKTDEAEHERLRKEADKICGTPPPTGHVPRECERARDAVQYSENRLLNKIEPARNALVGAAQALLIAEELCKEPEFREKLQQLYDVETRHSSKGDKPKSGQK